MNLMKKILIIPHHPGLYNIKVRLVEIARILSKKYPVYLVNWRAALGEYSMGMRVFLTLRDMFNKTKFYKNGTLNIVEFPTLHRPLCLVPWFNSFWLKRIIEREKIDIVINGSYYMFNIPERRDFRYIFDIADLPILGDNTYFDRFIARQVGREIKKADIITVVSNGLVKYIFQNYQRKAFFIPNGADVEKMLSVKEADIDRIRQRYNLLGKWVIGYIGRIGPWVNVELVVEAFQEIASQMPDSVLMWIGLSPDIEDLRKRYARDNMIFTGGIREDIEPYFRLLDVGILPHRKCLFQDLAFHLKLIEYTAARRFVISTPLAEMKLLNLPNLIFAQEDKNSWVEAIKRARHMKWDEQWNGLVEDYDWSRICQKIVDIVGIEGT